MQQIADVELLEDHISSCQEQANQLSETLMSLELQLVDQLEVRIKTYRCILLAELLTPKFEHLAKMLILRPWSKFRWVFSSFEQIWRM